MGQGDMQAAPGGANDAPGTAKPFDGLTAPGKVEGLSLWVVLGILAVAFALRVGYVLTIKGDPQFPDEKEYLNCAENLLKGEGLIVTVDGRSGDTLYYPLFIARLPVYPMMLAVATRIGLDIRGIRVLQAVLGALSCLMIYILATELVGERAGRIAGFVAAVYPFFIYFTGLILSETLFILLLVVSWYYVVRMWKELCAGEKTTRWMASCLAGGLIASVAALTRGSALAVFALVPVVWLIIGPKRGEGFLTGLIFLVVLGVGISPWVTRNHWVTRNYKHSADSKAGGRLVLTTLKVGESLYEAVGPFATGGPGKDEAMLPVQAGASPADEYGRNQWLIERSLAYMRENPRRTLRLALEKLRRTWNVVPNYDQARTPFYITVSLVSVVPVLLGGIVGLGACLRRGRVAVWVLLPIVVFTLIHAVFVGSIRYRLPMMPFVMVFTGVGFLWVFTKLFKRPVESVEKMD